MRAIVITEYGGPEVLRIEERPDPVPAADQVLIEVKAFGLNHAECYFRAGLWGEVPEITGIECVGRVRADPTGRFTVGETVVALVGGMGRTINGAYAELVAVPEANVAAVKTELPWEDLAALPESYATAWIALNSVLSLSAGQVLLVRGATSALGQAAVNIARVMGLHVLGSTRKVERTGLLRDLGVHEVLLEAETLPDCLRAAHPSGIDAVLDIVGNTTVLGSLKTVKPGGRVCQVGFLGGGGPLSLEPVFQIPGGRFLTAFASALAVGSDDFPVSDIPFQAIVDRALAGAYKATPSHILAFEDIRKGHALLEAGTAGGKVVVRMAS